MTDILERGPANDARPLPQTDLPDLAQIDYRHEPGPFDTLHPKAEPGYVGRHRRPQ
jgi:hypothetical protein